MKICMRSVMALVIIAMLSSCGTIKNKSDNNPEPTALTEVCKFTEYNVLPNISSQLDSMCFANGKSYAVGESAGHLDNCNNSFCSLDTIDQKPALISTLIACHSPKTHQICRQNNWVFSHCFKFINSEGKSCTCNEGEIQCI